MMPVHSAECPPCEWSQTTARSSSLSSGICRAARRESSPAGASPSRADPPRGPARPRPYRRDGLHLRAGERRYPAEGEGTITRRGGAAGYACTKRAARSTTSPCNHALETLLDAYLAAAGIQDDPEGPLFRTVPSRAAHELTRNPLWQQDAYRMIQRRAKAGGHQDAHR